MCELAFEKKGKQGIWQLYNSTAENLNMELENIFGLPIKSINKKIISHAFLLNIPI